MEDTRLTLSHAARSLLGAPRDRGRAHQHVLRRGAPAVPRNDAAQDRVNWWEVRSRRHDVVRVPATGRSTRERARRGMADGHEPEDRQSRVRQAVGARALPQGPRLRPRRPDPAQHRLARRTSGTTSCSPPSRTGRAPRPRPRSRPCSLRSPGRSLPTAAWWWCSRPGTTRHGDRAPDLAGRRAVRDPAAHVDQGARSPAQRRRAEAVHVRACRRQPGAVQLPHARHAERGHQPAHDVDRARSLERRRLRGPDRRRAGRRRHAGRQLPRRSPTTSCSSTAVCGSRTRASSSSRTEIERERVTGSA